MSSAVVTNNHLSHILTNWYPNKDNFDWVLATIYDTKGPCYRKSGAMMLFSSQGDQLGMLSGGCLESDISINARKVMQTGEAISLCYDGEDEDDMSFQLGIGCGGTVYIMLQKVNVENDYLSLLDLHKALQNRVSGYYYQKIITQNGDDSQSYFETSSINDIAEVASTKQGVTNNSEKTTYLVNPIVPEPHLLVVGGGIDARPLVNMAKQLGWQVSLWDPRPANGRIEFFSNLDHIIKGQPEILTKFVQEKQVNAAILMSHNVEIDAQALAALCSTKLQYLALLGPENRRSKVIAQTKLAPSIQDNLHNNNLAFKFSGPAGLDIGGTIPESIALSILSECHASLFQKDAHSLSQVL